MKYSKSKYPLGATWECTTEDGKRGTIWLAEISDYGWEVWRWSYSYSDGTGGNFDWATSYALCRNDIPVRGRFKRVK